MLHVVVSTSVCLFASATVLPPLAKAALAASPAPDTPPACVSESEVLPVHPTFVKFVGPIYRILIMSAGVDDGAKVVPA